MSFYKTDEEYTNDDTFFLLRKLCRVKTLLGAAISNDGEMKVCDTPKPQGPNLEDSKAASQIDTPTLHPRPKSTRSP